MKRESINARTNAYARATELGMLYARDEQETYWNESACYRFSLGEIEEIESATAKLHVMCLNAVQYVIDHNLFDRLKIPPQFVPYIKQSWAQGDRSIYGRFDLAYDGTKPPKMLEYNADTPTSLLEASVIQYDWLKQKKEAGDLPATADQFNFIHESLLRAWKEVGREIAATSGKVHFAAMMDNIEDAQTTNYMADVADEAGIAAEVMDIRDIGSDKNYFYDKKSRVIANMFKLYPWEWMCQDKYGQQTTNNRTRFIEPAWKMILSNKGIMAILWEMYPGHPNLLPTYDHPDMIEGSYVTKPFISREGANVTIYDPRHGESRDGNYGREGLIYQAYTPLPDFGGHFPIIGSWITSSQPTYPDMPTHPRGGEACGIGIREDTSRITNNSSQFVPHYFMPQPAG